ncbi:hypothetical protein [Nocardia neocaledoniensis]|uniref:hypothetical protein n=1 Tax=Nocardia neocaledoniensis TaxID=236511 RepID=UPI0024560373|nr:hypothetical protein [Nocardia neocaledoniensis]
MRRLSATLFVGRRQIAGGLVVTWQRAAESTVSTRHGAAGPALGAGQGAAGIVLGAGKGPVGMVLGAGQQATALVTRLPRLTRALPGELTGLPCRTRRGAGWLCGALAIERLRVAGRLAVGVGHGAARVGLGAGTRVDRLTLGARQRARGRTRALHREFAGLPRTRRGPGWSRRALALEGRRVAGGLAVIVEDGTGLVAGPRVALSAVRPGGLRALALQLAGQLHAGKFAGQTGLRAEAGVPRSTAGILAGTAPSGHTAWSTGITRSEIIVWSPCSAGPARSTLRGFAGPSRPGVNVGSTGVAGSAGSGLRVFGRLRPESAIGCVLAGSSGVTTITALVAVGGRLTPAVRVAGHLPRLPQTLERGVGRLPIRQPRTPRPPTGDVVPLLPGRHPALPRRDGRVALRRSVAIIVVVVPMSGIIVAHHASCTRRNPRCPPVR